MLQVEWIPATFLYDNVDYVPRIELLKVDLQQATKTSNRREKKKPGRDTTTTGPCTL